MKVFSHIIHCNVDFEVSTAVFQKSTHLVLKEISNSVEFHDIFGLFRQPKFVKFHKEVGIQVMEVFEDWPPFGLNVAGGANVKHMCFGTAVHQ